MNYLSVETLGRNVGERWLFRDLTFGILQGEKVALIGANGSGKSSLIEVLTGKVAADEGVVSTNKAVTVGYLDQSPDYVGSETIMEALFTSVNPVTKAIQKYEEALEKQNTEEISHYSELLTQLNGWDYEVQVKQILGKLGIYDLERQMSTLSGGQKKRISLAKVLIQSPEFIILDEPTNHLDLEAIEWLESYLSSKNTTLLLITHDRYFLDKVCNRILELQHGNIVKYNGNYAYYLEKKAERAEIETATQEKDRNTFRKELEWMRRQPKARTSKAQYRIDAFEGLKEKTSQVRKTEKLELGIKSERVGRKILEINHVSKSYGERVIISEFTYTFKRGDRIGIVGKNGVGKSTLLGLLTQEIRPDMGKVAIGETIQLGYYRQSGLAFDPDQKVIDSVREIAEYIRLSNGREVSVSVLLTQFLFPPAMQYSPVSKLSGGEKRRLQLLKILVKSPNFLILDEPTNDLDIETLNVLEEFLLDFQGLLVVVSHDRYFLDRVVNQVFAFEGEGRIKEFPGNYTEYRSYLEEKTREGRKIEKKEVEKKSRDEEVEKIRKLTYKEKIEFESLENKLAELERKKKELTEKISNPNLVFEQLSEVSDALKSLMEEIEEKEMRWLELSDIRG